MDSVPLPEAIAPAPPPTEKPKAWSGIGTVVGNTSTSDYTFILRSLQAKVGDIVATHVDVPVGPDGAFEEATVWGRIVSIERFNPFFPTEAAQELADQNLDIMQTVLSGSRDHLEADVLILGTTFGNDPGARRMSPLTYPVRPSAKVHYPGAEDVQRLLVGDENDATVKLRIGSLIARGDVEVSLEAKQVVSRHLAILAMTGGGKTVAARQIMKELIVRRYPMVIFDPHGDYLGFAEKAHRFSKSAIKVFYPQIRVSARNADAVSELIAKMGKRLTDPQIDFYNTVVTDTPTAGSETAAEYIQRLLDAMDRRQPPPGGGGQGGHQPLHATVNAVKRSLRLVLGNLRQMEANNLHLRSQDRFSGYDFKEMPNAMDRPEAIVRPGQVSILYLAGYDHLTQSAIVSIVLEALFHHRSTKRPADIPPFQAVIEEAHNFIPSRQEGTDETPSLATIRRVITEGRKFGTGLILISQRPSRLDETTLAQCNSFLVLRLVNPKDKSFVRSVMENLTEQDANILSSFGPGQGIVSGQAVRFPLLVKVDNDKDLVSTAIGDEDFLTEAAEWKPNERREKASASDEAYSRATERPAPATPHAAAPGKPRTVAPPKKQRGIRRNIGPAT